MVSAVQDRQMSDYSGTVVCILPAAFSAAMGCLLGDFYGRLAEGRRAVQCCGFYNLPACFMGGKGCLGEKGSRFSFKEREAAHEAYPAETEMLFDFGGTGLFDHCVFLSRIFSGTGR